MASILLHFRINQEGYFEYKFGILECRERILAQESANTEPTESEKNRLAQAEEEGARKRILIFEADRSLVQLLACESDFAVCEPRNYSSHRIRRTVVGQRPDLVLVNLTPCEKEGLNLIREIRSFHQQTKVLAISMRASHASRALRAGADGYIHADEDSKELAFAIRDVLSGHLYVSEAALCRNSVSEPAYQLVARPAI